MQLRQRMLSNSCQLRHQQISCDPCSSALQVIFAVIAVRRIIKNLLQSVIVLQLVVTNHNGDLMRSSAIHLGHFGSDVAHAFIEVFIHFCPFAFFVKEEQLK